MKKLVVRADDIGYSEGVTLGIISSYKNGIVTSAGIMVNMPFSRQAIEMVKNDDVCFGLHVNLVIGEPCCKEHIKIKNLLDEQVKRFLIMKKYMKKFVLKLKLTSCI